MPYMACILLRRVFYYNVNFVCETRDAERRRLKYLVYVLSATSNTVAIKVVNPLKSMADKLNQSVLMLKKVYGEVRMSRDGKVR